jgi:hypothetical protein
MLLAFTIPDALWPTFAGALSGSLIASGIVAYLTQNWIEKRERRNRRDDLRLELYLKAVDLVLDNELALAKRGTEGTIAPAELQTKRLRISHRLKMLGSQPVREAYDAYGRLVFQETAHSVQDRPKNPDDVVRARDHLIELMAKDTQTT